MRKDDLDDETTLLPFDEPPPTQQQQPRPIPLKWVVLVALLIPSVFVVIVALSPGAIKERPLEDAGIAEVVRHPVDAGDVEKALEAVPVKTAKGKLLKEKMKKRASEQKLAAAKSSTDTNPRGVQGTGAAGNAIALGGDASMRRAMSGKLKGLRLVDNSADAAYSVSLRLERGQNGDGTVYAKCSGAIAQMPGNRLIGGLASQADVGGSGSRASLEKDATDACAASLAEDLIVWVRNR